MATRTTDTRRLKKSLILCSRNSNKYSGCGNRGLFSYLDKTNYLSKLEIKKISLKEKIYEVEKCDQETVCLTTGETLSHDELVKSARLSYAICYASAQGLTLPGRVRLEDTTNKHFGLRHLYVGASRCTSCFLLEVA